MKKNIINNESGAVAIEFALIAILFFTLVVGIMEAGRVFWTQNALQYAVEQAARVALVTEDYTNTEIEDEVDASLQAMLIPSTGVITSIDTITLNSVEYIEITANYTYNSMVNVLLPSGWDSIDLTAYTRRPLVWQ